MFVRGLLALAKGSSAECDASFEPEHPIFTGHFPGNPLVPGVILTEALAQTAGIAAASGFPENARPLFLLSAIRSMKFHRTVRPGENIVLRAEKAAQMEQLFQFSVRASVAGETVAEGQLVLSFAQSR